MPEISRAKKHSARTIALAIAAYSLLISWFTYPLIGRLGSALAGRSTDAEQFLWSYWWFHQALAVQHTTPFWTTMLYYPEGISLRFHTTNTLNALLSVPLQALVGLVPAFNLIGLITLLASALAAAWLAYALSGSAFGAFIAGIAWAFAPRQIFHWRVGQMNMLSVEFVPVYVLCLWRSLAPASARPLRWVLGASASFVCAALCDWQFGLYLGLFSSLALGAALVAHRAAWWKTCRRALAIAVLAGLTLAPYILPMLAELQGSAPYMLRTPQDTLIHAADVLAFFMPNPAHPLWGNWSQHQLDRLSTPGALTTVVSLSYVTLVLAIVGAIAYWRAARFWVLVAAIFWVLALGPRLRIFGGVTSLALPYLALFQFKVVQVSRFPARFALITLLCLALLAALGVRAISARLDRTNRRWEAAIVKSGVLAALVFELWPASRFVAPLAPTPAFFVDGTLANAGALLELPNPSNRGMYYATQHQHPVLFGELSRDNPAGPILAYLRSGLGRAEIMRSTTNWSCVAGFFNVTHLVLYHHLAGPNKTSAEQALAQLGPQQLLRDTPEAALYQLPPAPEQTCLVLGAGWSSPRPFGPGQPVYRWAQQEAELGILRRTDGEVTLEVSAHSFAHPRQLEITRNGEVMAQYTVGISAQPLSLTVAAPAGFTWLTLRALEPAQSPADFGYPETQPVAIGFADLAVRE